MRLWHKELIRVLPVGLLIEQWRDCCELARKIAVELDPRDYLVNRVTEYPIEHFLSYTRLVIDQLLLEELEFNWYDFGKWAKHMDSWIDDPLIDFNYIFEDWHNGRYFWQCYYNLQERYDAGEISQSEWECICDECADKLYPQE